MSGMPSGETLVEKEYEPEICWTPLPSCVRRILTVGGGGRRRERILQETNASGGGEREWWLDVEVEVRKCDHIWDIFKGRCDSTC